MSKKNKEKTEKVIIEDEITIDEEGTVTEEVTIVEENAEIDESQNDENAVIIEDEISIDEDGTVTETVTVIEEASTFDDDSMKQNHKENTASTNTAPKEKSSDIKQIAMWVGLIIVVIAAMFGANYFVNEQEMNKQIDGYVLNTQINLADEETKEAVKNGDIVVMDFTGYVDDKEFDGGSADDARIQIGSKTFIDNFEDQLVGKKKDDKVDVKVTFPEDYGNEALNGKEATFKVTIKHVYKLPEANDKLVKKYVKFAGEQGDTSANDIKSYSDFRAYLRNYIEQMEAYQKELAKYQQQQQESSQDVQDSSEVEEEAAE